MDPSTELESFKSEIRLHEYAASLGYVVDPSESSKREIVLRAGGDKISIRRDTDGHYVYYSFRDHADNGTILDFIKRRQGKNLGEARKVLRVWLGRDRQITIPAFEHLTPAPRANRAKVQAEYAAMKNLHWHDYLEKERCLPRLVLRGPRFKGCIRVDARSNAIFPHYDGKALCGFEKRNRDFKAFASEGEKGLWLSNQLPGDRRLVIGESAIDCISHHAVFTDEYTRYASIAGGLNPIQPDLILKQCDSLLPSAEVVAITHADVDGDRYAAVIRQCILDTGRYDLAFNIHRPAEVKDWNDVLRQSASFPAAQGDVSN